MDINIINKLYYKEKDYSGIKEILKDEKDSRSFNILGKIYLNELRPDEAFECFFKANNAINCGYTKFLTGEISEAKLILITQKGINPFVNWLLSLIEIVENKNSYVLTYFGIRNFYEQDLEMLFKYKQKEAIEKIIRSNPEISRYNREIYKYSARVMLNNDYLEAAEDLIKKSIDIYYKDPETHFIAGEIEEKKGNMEDAKKYYKNALEVNGIYLPAEIKLKYLNN